MFTAHEFNNVITAGNYIKKILAELDTPNETEFQIIHSQSEVECTEDGGNWENIANNIFRFLVHLRDTQGFMVFDEDHWDFLKWEEEFPINVFRPEDKNETFVRRNDGLVVIYDRFALCEFQFPVIVIKQTFWKKYGQYILDTLRKSKPDEDYTSIISPALYIEIFYV